MAGIDVCLGAKNDPKYRCEECDYSTSKICNWKRHVESKKHKMLDNAGYTALATCILTFAQPSLYRCRGAAFVRQVLCRETVVGAGSAASIS